MKRIFKSIILTSVFSLICLDYSFGYSIPENKNLKATYRISPVDGKEMLFKVVLRLKNIGDQEIRLHNIKDIYDPKDAGILQISTHFAFQPTLTSCSMRQTFEGSYTEKISKSIKPGESISEEWVMSGQNINSANFERGPTDAGICINKPGEYNTKVFLMFTEDDFWDKLDFIVESNEQTLTVNDF